MIKHFCDVCGCETTRNYVSDRLKRSCKDFQVEVTVGKNPTWNRGDICLKCLLDVINNGLDTKESELAYTLREIGVKTRSTR